MKNNSQISYIEVVTTKQRKIDNRKEFIQFLFFPAVILFIWTVVRLFMKLPDSSTEDIRTVEQIFLCYCGLAAAVIIGYALTKILDWRYGKLEKERKKILAHLWIY